MNLIMNSKNKSLLGNIPPIAQYIGAGVTAWLVYLLLHGGAVLNHDIIQPKTVVKIQNNVKIGLSPMSVSGANVQNHFTLNGSVPSETIKANIDNELRATFGEGNYTNNLTVNDQLKPAKWLDHLKGYFDFFKLPSAEMTTNADVITLSGTAIAVKDSLSSFVGTDTTVKALDIASNVQTANTNALTALDALSVNSDTRSILDAMNLQIINFASGSTAIPAINQDVLKKAAALLKVKTTPFEIAGHADNKGKEVANLSLSQARAKAIRDFLVKQQVPANLMHVKGYGSSMPVASNDTETGRLKNRRIEYKLMK